MVGTITTQKPVFCFYETDISNMINQIKTPTLLMEHILLYLGDLLPFTVYFYRTIYQHTP